MRVRRGVLGRVPRFLQFRLRGRNILVGQRLLIEVVVETHVLDHHIQRRYPGTGDALLTSDRRFIGGISLTPRALSCSASGHLILFQPCLISFD